MHPQPASLSEHPPFWLRFLPLLAALLLLASTHWSQLPRELWSDEAFTATYTLHPDVEAVLEDVRKNEETPPLFFILEWAWANAAGRSEPLLRLPSMLFGVLAVVVYARAVQRWLSPGGAAIATATLALSPLVARYMVEARCYMLFLLCSVLCMVLFERIYHHPEDRRSFAAYALAAGALMQTFYFGVVMVAAHNLIWLTALVWNRNGWRNRLRSWVLVQLCVITIVLPWLPSLFYQYAVAPATTHIPTINPMITLLFFLSIIFSYPPVPWLWEAWLLIAGLFWLVMVVGLLRMRESSAEGGLVLRMFVVPMLMFLVLHLTTRANTPPACCSSCCRVGQSVLRWGGVFSGSGTLVWEVCLLWCWWVGWCCTGWWGHWQHPHPTPSGHKRLMWWRSVPGRATWCYCTHRGSSARLHTIITDRRYHCSERTTTMISIPFRGTVFRIPGPLRMQSRRFVAIGGCGWFTTRSGITCNTRSTCPTRCWKRGTPANPRCFSMSCPNYQRIHRGKKW